MKGTFFKFLLLAFVYGVTSAPTKKIATDSDKVKSFNLAITRSGFSVHDTSISPAQRIGMIHRHMTRTAAKFGATINSRISQRSNNNQQQMGDGSNDIFYFATVLIGSPPVAFEVQLDTGSADLIIMSNPCVTGCDDSLAQLYRPQDSSTTQDLNKAFNISYGSGGASGRLTSDVVSFAGFTLTQIFGALTHSEGIYQSQSGGTGILGLGWQAIASSTAIPFVQALYNSNVLSQPMFAMALARTLSGDVQPGGFINVGGVDTTLYTGDITWISSPEQSYWGIPLLATTLNGKDIGISTSYAIIDSGTSLLYIPEKQAKQLYAAIPGSKVRADGLFLYPCASNPQVAFNFGGVFWSISNADFSLGQADNAGNCLGAIGFFDDTTYIFGDTFMKNVYSIFRFSPNSIGFAALATSSHLQAGYVPVGNGTNIAHGANSTTPNPTPVNPSSSPTSTSISSTSSATSSSSSSSTTTTTSSDTLTTTSSDTSTTTSSDTSTTTSSDTSTTTSSDTSTTISSTTISSTTTSSTSSTSSASSTMLSDTSSSTSSSSSSASSSTSTINDSTASSTTSATSTTTIPLPMSIPATPAIATPTAYNIIVTGPSGNKLGYISNKETAAGILTWKTSLSSALVIVPASSLTSSMAPINLAAKFSTNSSFSNLGIGLGFWGNVFDRNQKAYAWLTATSNNPDSKLFSNAGKWQHGLSESKVWVVGTIDKNSRYPLSLNFVDKASSNVTCGKFFSYTGTVANEIGMTCSSPGLTRGFDHNVRLSLVAVK